MSNPLEVKLQTAMQATAALVATLGLRADGAAAIYNIQLAQSSNMPAIVYQRIAGAPLSQIDGSNALERARMQFLIWGTTPAQCAAVEAQLLVFLEAFSATGYPIGANSTIDIGAGGFVETTPLRYWRRFDVYIFNSNIEN